MAVCQLRITMAQNFVDGSGDFTTFNMGAFDVVCGANQSAGQCLNTVAVDQDQIWLIFHYKVRKPQNGFRQNHILRVAGPLVDKFMHCGARQAVDLNFGQPVALHHMHAGDKK